jgi:hypothetical protein
VKKQTPKNPHAVALGRLGGLVQSEAKKRANKQNGCKGGLVKSCRKTICRPAQRSPATTRMPQERMSAAVASIRARFGQHAVGLDYLGIRLLGHFGYFGITGNAWALRNFRHRCHRCHRHMAEMAKSPLPAGLDILGGILRVFVRNPWPQPGIRPSAITLRSREQTGSV